MCSENRFLPDPAPPQDSGNLPLKADKYLDYLKDCELTENQKIEFLTVLWNIMATFVRLGFDVEYALPILFQRASENSGNALEQTIPTHEFNVAADDEAGEKEQSP